MSPEALALLCIFKSNYFPSTSSQFLLFYFTGIEHLKLVALLRDISHKTCDQALELFAVSGSSAPSAPLPSLHLLYLLSINCLLPLSLFPCPRSP